MMIKSLITIGNQEISSHVKSSTCVVLFFTDRNSRVTESTRYIKDGHHWYSIDSKADDITAHLLDYSVSKWYTSVQEHGDLSHYIAAIYAQPTDLDEQRQTNSFQGRNWK